MSPLDAMHDGCVDISIVDCQEWIRHAKRLFYILLKRTIGVKEEICSLKHEKERLLQNYTDFINVCFRTILKLKINFV